VQQMADIIRVHDVKEMRRVVDMAYAIVSAQ
jgi:dihydropteroate synthase